jgi:uncharacterized membrane protein YjjP (DUF1212 family)
MTADKANPDRTPPPPREASFAERLAWFQAQPHFKRTWIYLVAVSVVLILASVFFLIIAAQDGISGKLVLAIFWAFAATFFSVMTWRIRPGAR